MQRLTCPKCRQFVFFEQGQCPACGQALVFEPSGPTMRALQPAESCANRELIGCNWHVHDDRGYCLSCSLTRTIPNLDLGRNLILWNRVEQAKRRLVYDLCRLKLPLISQTGDRIGFDILSDVAGQPILTGHLAGLITLSLAEADDVERESRRVAFRETYRTLLGHFRHEVGHFYWELLVRGTRLEGPFTIVFGDANRDYQTSLGEYHGRIDRAWDQDGFISEYATSHPWEDWAETFAHFLHIVSVLDSVGKLPLSVDSRSLQTLEDPYLESDFEALLSSWTPLAYSMNELNRSMGLGDAYPFRLSRAVSGKLHFVHMAIEDFRNGAGGAK